MRFSRVAKEIGLMELVAPYISIIGAISHFEPGRSTKSERGWTMAWLVAGQFPGTLEKFMEAWLGISDQGKTYLEEGRKSCQYNLFCGFLGFGRYLWTLLHWCLRGDSVVWLMCSFRLKNTLAVLLV
jgi:hypothetical protein